jgi:hypothetical protein
MLAGGMIFQPCTASGLGLFNCCCYYYYYYWDCLIVGIFWYITYNLWLMLLPLQPLRAIYRRVKTTFGQ